MGLDNKSFESSKCKRKGNVRKQILTAFIANLPAFTYGLQLGWMSPMAPILQSAESPSSSPLPDSAITWMASALPIGALLAVTPFSYFSDKLGRKKTLMLLSVLSAISWGTKLLTAEIPGLIAARAFAGLAAGGCFLVVPIYVREISEDHIRGALGSFLMLICNIGVITMYFLGTVLSYFTALWVCLTVPFLHLILFYYMPETPAYLIKQNKEDEAVSAIAWLRGYDKDNENVVKIIEQLKNEERIANETEATSFLQIARNKPAMRALRLSLVITGVQTSSGCFAVVNYAATIFIRAGTDWHPNILALLVGALQLAGSVIATFSVERFGRKMLLAGSVTVVSACMASIATWFLLVSLAVPVPGWIPVMAVCLCILSYGIGLAPVPYVIIAEIFNFELRARLTGAVMMFSWFNNTGTVMFFTPVANLFGDYTLFYVFTAVTLFGSVYTILWLPETKGKTLDEIKLNFVSKKEKDYLKKGSDAEKVCE